MCLYMSLLKMSAMLCNMGNTTGNRLHTFQTVGLENVHIEHHDWWWG